MPTPSTTRDDRIELRASREQKRLLAAAAAYERLDLTSFVMRTALPVAERIVARHERIVLTARDGQRLLSAREITFGGDGEIQAETLLLNAGDAGAKAY